MIGNAIQYSSVPCLFAMTQTIADERFWQTLGPILISPAGRLPVFLGRAVPVIANGLFVAAFSLFAGGLILGVSFDAAVWQRLVPVLLVGAFSCTGLGLVNAAIGLRVRETAVLSNVFVGLLLIFCGANVALSSLPGWMAGIGRALPLTHAIEAARAVASGSSLGSVSGLLGREAAVGAAYAVAGTLLLRWFELQSRRHATAGARMTALRVVWSGFLMNMKMLSTLELLPRHGDPAAGDLRDDRLLHVPIRGAPGHPAVRGARRRDDGRLVDDAVRLGRDDPVAAVAGHARARASPRRRPFGLSTCRSRSRPR